MLVRHVRLLALLGLVLIVALLASAGSAQDSTAPAAGAPLDLSSIGALLGAIGVALLGLWAVGRDLVNRMAARPTVDAWDRAKAVVDKLEPWAETLAKIADPKEPVGSPTPANPTGARP